MKTSLIAALFGLSLAATIQGHPEGWVGLSTTLCCLYFIRCRKNVHKRVKEPAPLHWPYITGGWESKGYRKRF